MINNEEFRSYLFSRLSMNSEVIGDLVSGGSATNGSAGATNGGAGGNSGNCSGSGTNAGGGAEYLVNYELERMQKLGMDVISEFLGGDGCIYEKVN